MAARLMREHNLTERDVDLASVTTERAKNRRYKPTMVDAALVEMVSQVFGTYHIVNQYDGGGIYKSFSEVVFVGEDPAAQIATYAYEVLALRLHQARQDYLATIPRRFKRANRIKRADDYAIGWVAGCIEAVKKLYPKQKPSELVMEYVGTTWTELDTYEPRKKGGYNGQRSYADGNQGYRDGRKQRIAAGVDGSDQTSPAAIGKGAKQLPHG
jgi:hypothetical protein